jgi:rhodanese-related sulfurtransferase
MTLPTISPADARQLFDKGASLVDIREADEHAREKILGAHNLPLSKLDESDLALQQGKPVIFHCGSGARALAHAPRLAAKAETCEAFVLDGGLNAWKRRRAPRRDRSAAAERSSVCCSVFSSRLGSTPSPRLSEPASSPQASPASAAWRACSCGRRGTGWCTAQARRS